MEDKRIIKTKRNIKETMIRLLQTTSFEKITVTQLCKEGETSRITFYTYYEDKYALIEEMFSGYVEEAVADYYQLQAANNPKREALYGYYHMLECILNLYARHNAFFIQATPDRNPYLYSAFFHHIFASVENYIISHSKYLKPQYSSRQTAALLCNGLWGVINECYSISDNLTELRENVMAMYRDILRSDLFIVQKA